MTTKRPTISHDSWICFSDILLTLVCSLVFLHASQVLESGEDIPDPHVVARQAEKLRERLRSIEEQVDAAFDELRRAQHLSSNLEGWDQNRGRDHEGAEQ